jgi:hypothetical protein
LQFLVVVVVVVAAAVTIIFLPQDLITVAKNIATHQNSCPFKTAPYRPKVF